MMLRRKAWLAFGLVASSGAAVAAAVDERMDAALDGSVEVVNRAGKVVVTGWSEAAVAVTGTLGENTLGLDFTREGDRVLVAVKYPEGGRGGRQASDLYVSLPAGSTLIVRSVSADVRVSAVEGEQRLKTVSGTIRTAAYAADLELGSVSGDMIITGQADVSVLNTSTVSGDLDATDLGGELTASSVSGDMDVTATTLSRARLKSTSGDIEVTADLARDGRVVLESMSGDVDLVIRNDEDLTVEAESFSGDVRTCFDATADGAGYGAGQSLHLTRGTGDRSVRITSFSGNVDLCDE